VPVQLGKFDHKVLQSYLAACVAYAKLNKQAEIGEADEELKQATLDFMQKVERLYQIDQ